MCASPRAQAGDEARIGFAVGTTIAGRPPHGSGRAQLTHQMWCATFCA